MVRLFVVSLVVLTVGCANGPTTAPTPVTDVKTVNLPTVQVNRILIQSPQYIDRTPTLLIQFAGTSNRDAREYELVRIDDTHFSIPGVEDVPVNMGTGAGDHKIWFSDLARYTGEGSNGTNIGGSEIVVGGIKLRTQGYANSPEYAYFQVDSTGKIR